MALTPQYGRLPFREQIHYMLGKVSVPTQSWIDVWRDAHDSGFMVAGAYKAELLNDLRQAVEDAIKNGTGLDGFRRRFKEIVERHGWSYNGSANWRSRVIYETNFSASLAAGRYAQLTDPDLLKVRPYWVYHHMDGEKYPRPLHLALNGRVIPANSSWWQSWYPPNGWGCQCYVTAESASSLRRKGLTVSTPPPLDYETRIVGQNSPTGPRTVRVPKGIDPGFDYAPGASRAEQLRNAARQTADRLPPPLSTDLKAEIEKGPPPAPTAPKPKHFEQPIADLLLPDFTRHVAPDVSTPARAAAVAFEQQIRNQPLEHGAFFNSAGQVLYRQTGEPDRVGYTQQVLQTMAGNTFTHNHPGGGTFSRADVVLAVEFAIAELRVVTPQLRYRFNGLDSISDRTAFAAAIDEIARQVSSELGDAVRTNQIAPADFQLYGDHLLWLRVATRFGLSYAREVS